MLNKDVIVTGKTIKPKIFYILFGLLILPTITTIVIVAVTLGIVISRLDSKNTTNSLDDSASMSFADRINGNELMKHLEQLQIIADQSNGTRAIGTRGFNDTLNYITNQLKQNTNLIIRHEYFSVRNVVVQNTAQLQSQINGIINNYVYLMDFTVVLFSPGANFDSFIRLVLIPNLGCQDSDWINAPAADLIALVKRGGCNFGDKAILAEKYGMKGLLVYNDGTSINGFQPYQNIRTYLNSIIPTYFLSYNLGMQLVNAVSNSNANVSIIMKSDVSNAEGVGNICADTRTGDKTKTIVIGSHSDGVLDGSGINDNGSGSIGTLVLALNLARLLETSSSNYAPYQYRVRFCWWGAEEPGLLGSRYHLDQIALPNATIEGERLQDYLLYLNYDMVAGPNVRFGILDSATLAPTIPQEAIFGTTRITSLFRQWFNEQKLPWSSSTLQGGSDYASFLVRGIAAGGVNTGSGGIKPASERDQYAAVLGIGNGGLANVAYDSCYHQQCDRIQNVNPFVYENIIKASAYTIEYMGRLNDLEKWLYSQGRAKNVELLDRNHLYDFHDD